MKRTMTMFATLLIAAPLYAQEVSVTPEQPSYKVAPNNAFEITTGVGYAQGFGSIGGEQGRLNDIMAPGGEFQLGLGWRSSRSFMIGFYGTGAKYGHRTAYSGSDIWTATAGVQANYHFMPANEWDPWVGFAIGWRGMWVSQNTGTDSRHGLDMGKVIAGVDYRVSSDFSVSPYASAGLTVFITKKLAQDTEWASTHAPDVNVWVSAGIQGRFDIFGKSKDPVQVASAD